jgi:hypothetical protein
MRSFEENVPCTPASASARVVQPKAAISSAVSTVTEAGTWAALSRFLVAATISGSARASRAST